MKAKLTPLVLAIAAVSYQPMSLAASIDDISINGFLSAGVGVSDNDEVSVGSIDEDASFKEDTTLGLQITAPVGNRFTLTGQLVARGTEDYEVDAAWAYASFQATDELSLRMGRLRAPFFYYSDFLEVGYAYHWTRPPEEVYRIGFSSIDAVDATYTREIGDVETSVQFYYGRLTEDLTISGTVIPFDLTNFTGIVFNATLDSYSARLSYHQADIGAPSIGAGTSGTDVTSFIEAALVYDDGDNLALFEWTATDHDAIALVDDVAWLFTYSRRFNDEISAHITYANEDDERESVAQPAMSDQESYIAGLRYDIESNVALKLEVQYKDEKVTDEDGMIYSAAVDMVF